MDKTIRKMFVSAKKEEAWLLEMAAKGLSLKAHKGFKYIFEETAPGEFLYKLVILDKSAYYTDEDGEDQGYLKMAQAEEISRNYSWSILKKRAINGPFPKHTNYDDRIIYLQAQEKRWTRSATIDGFAGVALLWMMWPGFFNNGDFTNLDWMRYVSGLFVLAGVGCLAMGVIYSLRLVTPIHKEIEMLRQESLAEPSIEE